MLCPLIYLLLTGTDQDRDLPWPSTLTNLHISDSRQEFRKEVSSYNKEESSSPQLDKKGLPDLSYQRKRPERPRCNAETSNALAFWCITTKTPLQHKRANASPGWHLFFPVCYKSYPKSTCFCHNHTFCLLSRTALASAEHSNSTDEARNPL